MRGCSKGAWVAGGSEALLGSCLALARTPGSPRHLAPTGPQIHSPCPRYACPHVSSTPTSQAYSFAQLEQTADCNGLRGA
jgi:hypothetical protein